MQNFCTVVTNGYITEPGRINKHMKDKIASCVKRMYNGTNITQGYYCMVYISQEHLQENKMKLYWSKTFDMPVHDDTVKLLHVTFRFLEGI